MTDWDDDTRQLRDNLRRILRDAQRDARRRLMPSVEDARGWHNDILQGLAPPRPDYVGKFRGEHGLERCEVAVGDDPGACR